jgi:TPR repeat protein
VNDLKKQLLLAAERGDAEAQFNLGMMYDNALDDSHYPTKGDRPEAMRWFLAAAEQGLCRAQVKLAELYADEPETPESSVKACTWFILAATGLRGAHLQKAQTAYRSASSRLTPVQIAEVRRFTQSWQPKAAVAALSPDHYEIIRNRARARGRPGSSRRSAFRS